VRSALEKVDGVEKVGVDFTDETVTVHSGGDLDEGAIRSALEDAGYGVEL